MQLFMNKTGASCNTHDVYAQDIGMLILLPFIISLLNIGTETDTCTELRKMSLSSPWFAVFCLLFREKWFASKAAMMCGHAHAMLLTSWPPFPLFLALRAPTKRF